MTTLNTYEDVQEALRPVAEWLRSNPDAAAVEVGLPDGFLVQATVLWTNHADALEKASCWEHLGPLKACLGQHPQVLAARPEWAS